MKDILLNDDNSLKITNGDFDTGESELQEVSLILQSSQGEWKAYPILGPNLFRFINAKSNKAEIEREVTIHFAMDNKDFKTLKTKIETFVNRGQ